MPSFPARHRARRPLAAVCALILVAGCAGGSVQDSDGAASPSDSAGPETLPPHSPAVDPGDGLAPLDPDSPMPGTAEGGPAQSERHVVAVLVPLTGRHSGAGESILAGAQMALFDSGETDVELRPYDTGSTPETAARAMRRAVDAGADIVVGPLLAGSVKAVRPIAESAGVNVVALSNSPSVAGPPIYLAGFTPAPQVARIVSDAVAEGRTRLAVLAPDTDYGDAVVSAVQDVIAAYESGERRPPPEVARRITEDGARAEDSRLSEGVSGVAPAAETPPAPVELARVAYYDPNTADHSDVIKGFADYGARQARLERQRRSLRAKDDEASQAALRRLEPLDTLGDPPYDAVLLPALDGQGLKILAAQLAYYDVDEPAVRLLGLQPWDGFGDLSGEPTLIGARYVAPSTELRARFAERFAGVYGRRPARLASLGYDVAAVAARLGGTGEGGQGVSRAALTARGGFVGADGLFRFTRDGLSERGFAVMEITRQGARVVDPAPRSFPSPATAGASAPPAS